MPDEFVLEPSLQLGYSSSDRVALVGYTIIPAILIGLIDVRQVKTTSVTAALTARYGLGNRFELEAKVPYSYVSGDTVSREIFTGTAQDSVFNADGHGLGDVELTGRYQLRNRGPDHPYYVLWLRYKSRTGRDLFLPAKAGRVRVRCYGGSPAIQVSTACNASSSRTRSARYPAAIRPRWSSMRRNRAGYSDAIRAASSSGKPSISTALRTAVAMSSAEPASAPAALRTTPPRAVMVSPYST